MYKSTRLIAEGRPSRNPIVNAANSLARQLVIPYEHFVQKTLPDVFFAVKNESDEWIPITPAKSPASASGTAITMSSASDAALFDPTDSDVNTNWADDAEVCYWDESAGTFECNGSSGAVYVSSVSGTGITLNEAFTADPTSSDIMTAGGLTDGQTIKDIAIVIKPIVESDDFAQDVVIDGYQNITIDYDMLSTDNQNFVDSVLSQATASRAHFLNAFTVTNYTS